MDTSENHESQERILENLVWYFYTRTEVYEFWPVDFPDPKSIYTHNETARIGTYTHFCTHWHTLPIDALCK